VATAAEATVEQIEDPHIVVTQYIVRDEEVVGSNPATPTEKVQANGLLADRGEWAVDHL
jgi:hypothetical protein